MLEKTIRFVAVNNTSTAMVYNSGARIAVSYRPWRFDSSGAIYYGAEVTGVLNNFGAGETISASGAPSDPGDVQDNSTNLYLGIHGSFLAITNGAGNGNIDLYVEASGVDGWPSDNSTESLASEDSTYVCSNIFSFGIPSSKLTNFSI